jgi:quercetin dioxygenase-like cupin family protein
LSCGTQSPDYQIIQLPNSICEEGWVHSVTRAHEYQLSEPPLYAGHSRGYTHASVIDHRGASVHTALSLNQLAPGGSIDPHVHSFEEGFYILEGQAALGDDSTTRGAGDFGVFKVAAPHAWRNAGSTPLRWLQMAAPQPKSIGSERDTFFPKAGRVRTESPLSGHFDASQAFLPESERPPGLAPGVFLKWMIDEQLGARHFRMVFIEYQPGANITLHDHTFEEAYYILSGESEATADGKKYVLKPGDVFWTGVGCVHSFANVGREPVRWIETFSPQPPAENVFRFMAEWEKRATELEG